MKKGRRTAFPWCRAEEIVLSRRPDSPGFLFAARKGPIAQKVRTYLQMSELPKLLIEWVTKLGEHVGALQPAEAVMLHRAA